MLEESRIAFALGSALRSHTAQPVLTSSVHSALCRSGAVEALTARRYSASGQRRGGAGPFAGGTFGNNPTIPSEAAEGFETLGFARLDCDRRRASTLANEEGADKGKGLQVHAQGSCQAHWGSRSHYLDSAVRRVRLHNIASSNRRF
ncbi:hypothetical protein ACJZ2D_006847 [Fusarium nematophilum]